MEIVLIFLGLFWVFTHVPLICVVADEFTLLEAEDIFLLPKEIYDMVDVNYFGAALLYILYFLVVPIFAVIAIFKWLFTVGRK